MMHADEPFGVGVMGFSARSRFFCERLALRSDLRFVARWADDVAKPTESSRWAGVASPQCLCAMTPTDLLTVPEVRVVHFAAGSSADVMIEALTRAKSIVVEAPHSLSREELERLAQVATGCQQVAAIFEPRRWDEDFLSALAAVRSGRIGRPLRLRYSVHDARVPGETFSTGVDRELGAPVLDQLLQLIGSPESAAPARVVSQVWRHFPSDHDRGDGFLAHFEFTDELCAVIEIQTRSLLGFRSGWMIEGTNGAYRHGRLYTRTADGEIVDEPLLVVSPAGDPFCDALVSALRGRTNDLSTVRAAANVAALLSETVVST